jgi:hypothetical protein
LKNNRSFEQKGEGMPARFPRLGKLVTKALEIAGAACASALTAVVLGNMREPPREPAAPAVVRLAPADEQMIRHVRDESLALVEQLRGASDARSQAAHVAPATAPAAKPAKPATTTAANRHEQKATHAQAADVRQRPGEPAATQSAAGSPGLDPTRVRAILDAMPSEPHPATPGASGGEPNVSSPNVSSLRAQMPSPQVPVVQVPSRLWPAAVSSSPDAPRPPIGVGANPSSSM